MEKNKPSIGDTIAIHQAEKSDTFYMVTIQGEKYLVDRNGKILLTPGQQKPQEVNPKNHPETRRENLIKPHRQPTSATAVHMRFRVKPGTPEFSRAVKEASAYMDFFLETLRRYYRWIAPRFDVYLDQTRTPYLKYFEQQKNGLANMKSFLIRDFFTRTTFIERGLEILEFLTLIIAYRLDGQTNVDSQLPLEDQRLMVLSFAEFLKKLGDVPVRERVIIKIYREFVEELTILLKEPEGVGFYLRSTQQRIHEKQRFFLDSEDQRNFLNSSFQKAMKQPSGFYLDNILAFLKAMTILRLNSHSHKEERGRNDLDREDFLYKIISYHPLGQY